MDTLKSIVESIKELGEMAHGIVTTALRPGQVFARLGNALTVDRE